VYFYSLKAQVDHATGSGVSIANRCAVNFSCSVCTISVSPASMPTIPPRMTSVRLCDRHGNRAGNGGVEN